MNNFQFSLYFKLNLLLTTILSLVFLFFYKEFAILNFIFTIFALISTTATLYLIYWILLKPFFYFKKSIYFIAPLLIFTNLALLADIAIYRVWNFHINAMVLNIALSPAAYDSLTFTTSSVFALLAIVSIIIYSQILFIKLAKKQERERAKKINLKRNLILIPILFLIIVGEKVSFSVANLNADSSILERTKLVPLYQPLLMDKFLISLGMEQANSDTKALKLENITNLNYPINQIKIPNPHKKNIFIFGVDALRNDMITSKIAPNIYNFSQDSVQFNNNFSGGNNTRFGIFSIFYGINSSYWFSFLNAKKGPVFFDVLNILHYQTSVISSTNTSWPEFKKTTFYNIQEKIKDDFEGSVLEKDKKTLDYFEQWIHNQDKSKPIFSFVWLDGVHGRAYDKSCKVFTPDNDATNNYLTANESQKVSLFNMYKNSVYCADKKFERFTKILQNNSLYDNSIIIVLSDHGQEFYEHGLYGHNSAYNFFQAGSVNIFKVPNRKPESVNHMTSHLDLVPTLLNILGVTNEFSDYSHGQNLFSDTYHRECSFIGNWNENAIACEKNTYIFSNIITKVFENTVLDSKSYKKTNDYNKSEMNKIILQTMKENQHFKGK